MKNTFVFVAAVAAGCVCAQGGKTVPENLQMLCRRCNALKSDKF